MQNAPCKTVTVNTAAKIILFFIIVSLRTYVYISIELAHLLLLYKKLIKMSSDLINKSASHDAETSTGSNSL